MPTTTPDRGAPPLTEAVLAKLAGQSFDAMPSGCRADAYGMDYLWFALPDGSELYVTRHGWPFIHNLLPQAWFYDRRYKTAGTRLTGSTGTLYRVPTMGPTGKALTLVTKFSRFAQEVPLQVMEEYPGFLTPEILAGAHFNSPFEEFGMLHRLRQSFSEKPPYRLLTQRPLAIYQPPQEFQLWQLGRSDWRFDSQESELQRQQSHARGVHEVHLQQNKQYVTIFGWVHGQNAEEMMDAGALSREDLGILTRQVIEDMRHRGFTVLDNKPKHYILRSDGRGGLLRRHGRLVYALIDYELLVTLSAKAQDDLHFLEPVP
jgi:hypothetical protein